MTLRLNGDSSGFTEIKAANAAGDNSIKLPASNGSANQLLQNGGTAGELQYTNAGGGLHVDSSGRLLRGVSTPRTNFFGGAITSMVQIEGNDHSGCATRGGMSIVNNNNATSFEAPFLLFGRSTGTSLGSVDAVSNGSQFGRLSFQGADGSNMVEGAHISGFVEGSPGTNVMPGKITFSTNAGSAAPTPRMEIGSNGALKLLAGCPGIDFSGIQTNTAGMTSETLDSYEQGTFTPILRGSGTAGTYVAGRASVGRYIRIGNMVTATADFNAGSFSGSTGAITITGLPFTVSGVGISANGDIPYETAASSMMYNVTFNSSYRQSWYLNPNASTAYGIETRSGTTWVDWASSSFHASTLYLTMTFVYTTA